MNRFRAKNLQAFDKEFLRVKRYLYISRPTAVSLMVTLDRMERCYYQAEEEAKDKSDFETIRFIRERLTAEARAIKLEDIQKCLAIAEAGFSLLKPGMGILTYCNAGHLAVSRYGTALSPIYYAQQKGYMPKVYSCETRPMLQGSRLTAYELTKAGIDVTLICDNMAADVMSRGKIDIVFFGCDRIAANGDVANKVGSSMLAILAKHFGIPCYSIGPSNTIDYNTPTGKDIKIEERASFEVTDMYFDKPVAPKGIKVYNPAFDVTPAELLTGIITEKGIISPKKLGTIKE
jgi:methylthioribose-1-phosphate isomerase